MEKRQGYAPAPMKPIPPDPMKPNVESDAQLWARICYVTGLSPKQPYQNGAYLDELAERYGLRRREGRLTIIGIDYGYSSEPVVFTSSTYGHTLTWERAK